MDSLKLVAIVTHVGMRVRVCFILQAILIANSDEQLIEAGIQPDLIVSIGIEDVTDIIADIEQALQQAKNNNCKKNRKREGDFRESPFLVFRNGADKNIVHTWQHFFKQ